MSDQLLSTVLQTYGPLGAVLIFAGWALNRLYNQITEVQEKRIADAQAATAKLLELVAKKHEHEALLARALDGNADAISDLRQLVESVLAERAAQRLPVPPPRRG